MPLGGNFQLYIPQIQTIFVEVNHQLMKKDRAVRINYEQQQSSSNNSEWTLEEILSSKIVDSKTHYKVRWKGGEVTQIPLQNMINCPEMLAQFQRKNKSLLPAYDFVTDRQQLVKSYKQMMIAEVGDEYGIIKNATNKEEASQQQFEKKWIDALQKEMKESYSTSSIQSIEKIIKTNKVDESQGLRQQQIKKKEIIITKLQSLRSHSRKITQKLAVRIVKELDAKIEQSIEKAQLQLNENHGNKLYNQSMKMENELNERKKNKAEQIQKELNKIREKLKKEKKSLSKQLENSCYLQKAQKHRFLSDHLQLRRNKAISSFQNFLGTRKKLIVSNIDKYVVDKEEQLYLSEKKRLEDMLIEFQSSVICESSRKPPFQEPQLLQIREKEQIQLKRKEKSEPQPIQPAEKFQSVQQEEKLQLSLIKQGKQGQQFHIVEQKLHNQEKQQYEQQNKEVQIEIRPQIVLKSSNQVQNQQSSDLFSIRQPNRPESANQNQLNSKEVQSNIIKQNAERQAPSQQKCQQYLIKPQYPFIEWPKLFKRYSQSSWEDLQRDDSQMEFILPSEQRREHQISASELNQISAPQSDHQPSQLPMNQEAQPKVEIKNDRLEDLKHVQDQIEKNDEQKIGSQLELLGKQSRGKLDSAHEQQILQMDNYQREEEQSQNSNQINKRNATRSLHQKDIIPNSWIYIQNIRFGTDYSQFFDFLKSKTSGFRLLRLPRDHYGKLKGFAFAKYGSIKTATAAIEALNGRSYKYKNLRVSFKMKKQ